MHRRRCRSLRGQANRMMHRARNSMSAQTGQAMMSTTNSRRATFKKTILKFKTKVR